MRNIGRSMTGAKALGKKTYIGPLMSADFACHKTIDMKGPVTEVLTLVMGRVRTTKGREVYGVRSFMNADPCRNRMIGAESLKPIDEAAWADCLLTPELAAKLSA